jgi:hypothetical protein
MRTKSVGDGGRSDEADRRLWQRWRQGEWPEVDEFLAQAGSLPPDQVAAVLLVD